ncbi:MAG: SPW repeat protein [Alphaproteobacteria bacterium]|nr:SPW repeat protein [Alphaproteobacteria bacterium]
MEKNTSILLPDKLSMFLGALLFVSPWLMGFSGEPLASWNAHIFGAVIFAMAVSETFAFKVWEEWISGAAGIWLILAPFLLGFNTHVAAVAVHILVGLATILLVAWSTTDHDTGHLA